MLWHLQFLGIFWKLFSCKNGNFPAFFPFLYANFDALPASETALLVYIFKVKVPKSELFEKLLTFNPSDEAIWSIRGSYTFLHVGVVPNDKNWITLTTNLQERKLYLHPAFVWLVSFTGGVKQEQKIFKCRCCNWLVTITWPLSRIDNMKRLVEQKPKHSTVDRKYLRIVC